ncbi:hypothetical protein IWQ62_003021 [Dispira parvispora]|uniref:Uncharacterized protein n=1 Tax=Dispira parvispora TaxID=1520584 RepID=A0A9W8ASL9_9FUNG|nr:hypothetical protein IWQ62_003021 [Dispira parvispora]
MDLNGLFHEALPESQGLYLASVNNDGDNVVTPASESVAPPLPWLSTSPTQPVPFSLTSPSDISASGFHRLFASRRNEERSVRPFVISYILWALRLSVSSPFPENRLRWTRYLNRLEQNRFAIPAPLVASPSFFIPLRDLVQLPQSDHSSVTVKPSLSTDFPFGLTLELMDHQDHTGWSCSKECQEAVVDVFREEHRLSNLCRVYMFFPSLMRYSFINISRLLRSQGPLQTHLCFYLGITACAEVGCYYGVSLLTYEFIRNGGDPTWLKGISHVPKSLQALVYFCSLLRNKPWLISKDHLRILRGGCATQQQLHEITQQCEREGCQSFTDTRPYTSVNAKRSPFQSDGNFRFRGGGWSTSEITHAVYVIASCQAFATVALGCGVAPEVDIPGGFTLTVTGQQDSQWRNHQRLESSSVLADDPFFSTVCQRLETYLNAEPTSNQLGLLSEGLCAVCQSPMAKHTATGHDSTWHLVKLLREHARDDYSKELAEELAEPSTLAFDSIITCLNSTAPQKVHLLRELINDLDSCAVSEPLISDISWTTSKGVEDHGSPTLSCTTLSDDDQPHTPPSFLLSAGLVPDKGETRVCPLPAKRCHAINAALASNMIIDVHQSTGAEFEPLKRLQAGVHQYVIPEEYRVPSAVHAASTGDGFYSCSYDLTWKHHGTPILASYLPHQESLCAKEFELTVNWTDGTVGDNVEIDWVANSGIDTEPFRCAIWKFTQALCGIQLSEYQYDLIPIYLTLATRQYITKLVLHPEQMSPRDFYYGVGMTLRVDEVCLVNLLVAQAKRQAVMLLALQQLID